jgi:NADPH:quinone reductase-like Zn-dependent oxidoreductase
MIQNRCDEVGHMSLSAVYTETGDPADVVKLIDVDEPGDPGPGQVLVRVTLFPIHWGDLQTIQLASPTGRVGAGVEATGVVEKVGSDVHHLKPGARVSVFPQPGAWAERITADAQFVVPVPDAVSDGVAAQMLVNPLTVLMLRREAERHFATGYDGVVLNNAAGGAVGRLVTASLSNHHIATISLVRRAETAQHLRDRFPAVPVVVTEDPDWLDAARDLIGGRTVGAALDPIGGALSADLLSLLSPGGTVVVYGRMADEPIPVHATALLDRGLTLSGATIGRWVASVSPEQRASDTNTACLMAQALSSQFDVAAIYPIAELSGAIRHATKPGKTGTVLVRP